MKKMPGHPRLYRRGAMYYHRAAIPVDIADTYPKSEETFTLKTRDYQEALKLVRVAAVEVDCRFEEHRRQQVRQAEPFVEDLDVQRLKHIENVYYAYLLEEDEEVRLDAFEGTSFEERSETIEDLNAIDRHEYARGQPGVFYKGEAEEVLTWSNVDIRLAPDSPAWPKVVRALQAASIRAAEAVQARNRGEVIDTPVMTDAAPQVSPVQVSATRKRGPLLSNLVEDWIEEKARTAWVPKTEREHRVWMAHFIAETGDRPLADYGKAEARAFKTLLMNLPANWNKFEQLKEFSIGKASERAKQLGMAPMSEKNINKLLGYVGSFWTWAHGQYDDCPENPFRGLQIKLKNHDVREERHPFTPDELRAIFNAPLYTGCASVREWASPGTLTPRDAGIFWVPLISLFTGARAGEAIQLYVDDVREDYGILHFDINADGEDKRLKNHHSRRVIPVHQTLVDIGFLKFVERQRRAGHNRLFSDLKMGEDGYYSSPFSKHFNRFLISVKVKTTKNAFHSFRHCFEDACRDNDISKEVMDTLQGHGEQGMSGRYGRGHMLNKLDEAMKKLRYEGLDLSCLCADLRTGG